MAHPRTRLRAFVSEHCQRARLLSVARSIQHIVAGHDVKSLMFLRHKPREGNRAKQILNLKAVSPASMERVNVESCRKPGVADDNQYPALASEDCLVRAYESGFTP